MVQVPTMGGVAGDRSNWLRLVKQLNQPIGCSQQHYIDVFSQYNIAAFGHYNPISNLVGNCHVKEHCHRDLPEGASSKQHRPSPKYESQRYVDLNQEENKVELFIPRNADQGYINNTEERKVFSFDQLFDMTTSQEKIFDKVAKDVIDSALQGYNGTIFAYGQTGSGKTYTMTGDSERYADRGIIPRTISYIFSKRQNKKVDVTLSYFQIYEEQGYDLLDAENETKKLTDLKKMQVMCAANGQMTIKNLSEHLVDNEEDALNLLFLGTVNRVVSKTPMNDESTRSHCIFMIKLVVSQPGSDIKSEAFLHLVDLSGSERIKQTGVEGLLEREARSINLSLHYLERVIVSLNKSNNATGEHVHIPYRDSLMTMVLKDSIGGNCKTRMIATMSPRTQDIAEGIATCKFAQRVAMIKNQIERNERVDPGVIIQRLKQENAQLKAELALLKGGDVKDELDKYQIEECREKVKQYMDTDDPSVKIILNDRLKIQECFYYFKMICREARATGGGGGVVAANKSAKPLENSSRLNNGSQPPPHPPAISNEDTLRYEDEIKKLRLLIHQRDNEIALLLSMISKNGNQGSVGINLPVKREEENLLVQSVLQPTNEVVFPAQIAQKQLEQKILAESSIKGGQSRTNINSNTNNESEMQEIQSMLLRPLNLTSQQLLNHTVAFEQFRKAYRKQEVIKQNEQVMRQKMQQGKEIGKIVNESRQELNRLKVRLQTLKKQMAVQSLVDNVEPAEHPEEAAITKEINRLREICRVNFDKLRQVKTEITTIQNLLKKNTEILQRDFEKYLAFTEKERREAMKGVEPSVLASSIQDEEVQKHLKSFFNAREQLRKR